MAEQAPSRSLSAQIAEVERELRLRSEVYPRQVTKGRLRQGEADEHMARMRAVLETLVRHRQVLPLLGDLRREMIHVLDATITASVASDRRALIERIDGLLPGETP